METLKLSILFTNADGDLRQKLESVLTSYQGKIVRTIGSACLCTFENSVSALHAAIEFRKNLSLKNCRIAITCGEVNVTKDGVSGYPANLAAQLEGVTEPGQIYFTETVYQELEGSSIPCHEIGPMSFKGCDQPIRIFVEGIKPQVTETSKIPQSKETVSPETSKELFDFARIEQERKQEATAIRPFLGTTTDPSAIIPLATLPEAKADLKDSTSSPILVSSETYRKPRFDLKKNLWVLFTFVFLIPSALILGSWAWGKYSQEEKETVFKERVDERLQNSTAFQAIHTDRTENNQTKTSSRARPDKPKAETYTALLVVKTQPPNAEVFVGGQKMAKTTPVRIKKVLTNHPIQITIRKPGYQAATQLLNLDPGEERIVQVQLVKK